MKTSTLLFAVVCLGLFACDSGKASESQCKKAVDNIRKITGLDKADLGARPETMVRSCRAQTTRASADCMIQAKTIEDLRGCEGETGAKFYEKEEERERKQLEKQAKEDNSGGDEGGDDKDDDQGGDSE